MSNPFQPIIKRLNITGVNKGKFASRLGEAHEYLAASLLIRIGFVVSVHASRGGTYDLIIEGFENFKRNPRKHRLLRAQIKTMNGLKFIGGTRAGVDRVYKPGVKAYKYTPEHSDLIIGVDRHTLDLYFVPTRFIKRWGVSVAKKKIEPLKNNLDVLLNWNARFLKSLERRLQ